MVLGSTTTTNGQTEAPLTIKPQDVEVLRNLAEKVAEIATRPSEEEKRQLWYRHNRLERVKPMILTYPDNSWNELLPDEALVTEGAFARKHEKDLRMRLFAHEHWNDDMPVEAVVFWDRAISDSGFGIEADEERTESIGGAMHFEPVIKEEADIDLIKTPVLDEDKERSNEERDLTTEVFGGTLRVEERGFNQVWCAMMDDLLTWRGINDLMLDFYERPEWLHEVMRRMTDGWLSRIEQANRMGLFTVANDNEYVGSGGVAYTGELPRADFDGTHVKSTDLWGQAAAQILTTVSPEMHNEFALRYEKEVLSHFGLNCYGCCEALHHKMDYVSQIPNLRRVSMSPWVDVEVGAAAVQDKYVFSSKPNPEIVLHEPFDEEAVRQDVTMRLEKTRGCVVEIILKDVHTCKGDVSRLTKWTEIAQEVAERF